MAYVTLEDDTGAMELLVFARVLGESGGYIKENAPVLATGRLSVRDEKAPQMLVDSIRPLGEAGTAVKERESGQKLYVKVATAQSPQFEKIKKIFLMFPGEQQAVFYFSDTRKRMGTPCVIHPALIRELGEMLGGENVVLK